MHAFTSITANYLPKARVLASTLKKHNPEFQFHLLLSDSAPASFNIDSEPFDSVINVSELAISNKDAWIFKHTVVECCTAVKGYGFLEIVTRYSAEKVFYFDPDMAVFSSLESLLKALDDHYHTPSFSNGLGRTLISAPFQPEPDLDGHALADLIRDFIRRNP